MSQKEPSPMTLKGKGGKPYWLGPLGWKIIQDIDKHKGVWKLFNKAGERIATLAADGTILGK